MEASPLVAILVLIFPFVGAVGMIWFMMGGKGKPAPTQDEIVAEKQKRKTDQPAE